MSYRGALDQYRISAERSIDAALKHVERRRIAVQAGGHAGQFAIYLAKKFDVVYTWEPSGRDFADLVYNMSEAGVVDQVYAARGFLGGTSGTGHLVGSSGSARRRHDEPGTIPVYRLDDLDFSVCDLMYLDVEGDEMNILDGAKKTLYRCRPLIAVEIRPKFVTPEAMDQFLGDLGYERVGEHASDVFYKLRC